MYLILYDLYSNQTNTYTTCRSPHKATSSLCLEKNWYCWQPYTRVFSVKRRKDTQAVHSLTVQTPLKTSADCSRSGKCFAVVIWKVWRSSDRTNANRSCGNLRCMWTALVERLASLQPTAGLLSSQQLLWNMPLHHVPHHDCHYHITYWSSRDNAPIFTKSWICMSLGWEAKFFFFEHKLSFFGKRGLAFRWPGGADVDDSDTLKSLIVF